MDYYVLVETGLLYKFNAPLDSYPTAIANGLGVNVGYPGVGAVTKAGTYADWRIARVRLVVTTPSGTSRSYYRLCASDKLSTAPAAIVGQSYAGGTISGVYVARKRILL